MLSHRTGSTRGVRTPSPSRFRVQGHFHQHHYHLTAQAARCHRTSNTCIPFSVFNAQVTIRKSPNRRRWAVVVHLVQSRQLSRHTTIYNRSPSPRSGRCRSSTESLSIIPWTHNPCHLATRNKTQRNARMAGQEVERSEALSGLRVEAKAASLS